MDRVHCASEGNLRVALQRKILPVVALTSRGSRAHSRAPLPSLSPPSSLLILDFSSFSYCFYLAQPHPSKDSQGCLTFWMPGTSFVHSISSSRLSPSPCVLSSSLSFFGQFGQCCLFITTEVSMVSWSRRQAVVVVFLPSERRQEVTVYF